MKKLFALLLALSMLITASTVVLAETTEITENTEIPFSASARAAYSTSNGLGTYNADGTIDITVTLSDISVPEAVAGISVFMLDIVYDKNMVVPAVEGAIDSDGEQFDFSAVLDEAPNGWECFGRVDSQNGVLEIAVWDPSSLASLGVDGSLSFTVPFKVKTNAMVGDIVFSFDNGEIVEPELVVSSSIAIDDIEISYAHQPDVLTDVPANAISLDIAGFKDASNIIYYAENEISVGEFVEAYSTSEDSVGMNGYAIAVVNPENNKIIHFDTDLGMPQGDKSGVIIPAGYYILGVNGNNTDDYAEFCENIDNNSIVMLYNVNVKGAYGNAELTNAAFVVTDPIPVLRKGVNAVYDHEQAIITVYDTNLTVGRFKGMFQNDVAVLDKNGNLYTYGYIETGMTIDYADGISIVMLGDVYSDGKIDQIDYILVKRHCFGTYKITGAALNAAHVAGKETVSSTDYVFIKRICFGTLTLADLM